MRLRHRTLRRRPQRDPSSDSVSFLFLERHHVAGECHRAPVVFSVTSLGLSSSRRLAEGWEVDSPSFHPFCHARLPFLPRTPLPAELPWRRTQERVCFGSEWPVTLLRWRRVHSGSVRHETASHGANGCGTGETSSSFCPTRAHLALPLENAFARASEPRRSQPGRGDRGSADPV